MKTWLAIGLIAIPIGSVIFGMILKVILSKINKINIKTSKACLIQLCAGTAGWLTILLSILVGLIDVPRSILLTISFLLSTFAAAFVYSKMITDSSNSPIGMKNGLIVAIVINIVAIALNIPLSLIRDVIA
jgi:hypothetical protein